MSRPSVIIPAPGKHTASVISFFLINNRIMYALCLVNFLAWSW